jgi:Bifunctional DNA primase/polymerase, N-terminal
VTARRILDPFSPELRDELFPNSVRRPATGDPFVSAERVQEVARQHAVASATHRRATEDYSQAAAAARRAHDDAAALAEAAPQFNPAWSASIGGLPVVALSPDGTEPVSAPTRDLDALVRTWTGHPDAPAGLACGREHDHLAATFDVDGYQRLVELASPVLATRDDDDFGIQRRMADHCGGFVQLQERKPGGPVTMRTASAFN